MLFLSLLIFISLFSILFLIWRTVAHSEKISGSFTKLKTPLFIFDFDGTLCPSYDLFVEQLNHYASYYGYRKVVGNEKELLRSFPVKDCMKKVGISWYKLPFIAKKIRGVVRDDLLALEPVPGIVEVLNTLKERGISLAILTSNSEENVRKYLEKYRIDFFDFIYSGSNIFGKEGHIEKILDKSGFAQQKAEVYYFGDELRDVQAAKKVGIKSVALSWGFNSIELLKSGHPDFLLVYPEELLEV